MASGCTGCTGCIIVMDSTLEEVAKGMARMGWCG
jgi:hypothetical protein